MQAQNVEEYKAIREELARVRSCITSYVSFVVLGSGPGFGFLAGKVSENPSNLAMAFAAILLGILSTLVLFLLSYKFTSCNRYAGYSKLLTHERFKLLEPVDKDIFLWEICVDKLRASDYDEERHKKYLEDCDTSKLNIQEIPLKILVKRFSGRNPTADGAAFLWGVRLLFLPWHERTGSWKLPLYIARIFATIVLAFVVFAVIFVHRSFTYGEFRVGPDAVVFLFVVLIALWMAFIAKLHRQMRGSETVEAFCRKFVPIRVQLLRELEAVDYALVGASISKDDEKEFGADKKAKTGKEPIKTTAAGT